MSYYDHSYISNSDLKAFKKKTQGTWEEPENLKAIFEFGSLFHQTILEPHLSNKEHPDYELALRMRDTFWADPVCRAFAMASDFEREKEYYEERQVGQYQVKLRCKCDGVRTRLKVLLELKGLNIESEKAFREALVRYDYDQAEAHYLHTADLEMALIVGISKKNPKKLFKYWSKRYDDFFLIGEQKMIDVLGEVRLLSPEDVKLVA